MLLPHRKIKVFFCHTSSDKPVVREIYKKIESEGWIEPWLDEEKLIAGLEWGIQIEKAVESTDVVIVFLSNQAITKEGYIQKELKLALDLALYKPESSIFIIPVRLDNSAVPFNLKSYQYIDYFPKEQINLSYKKLITSLEARATKLGIDLISAKAHYLKEIENLKKREIAEKIYKEAKEKIWREEENKIRKEAEEHARKEINILLKKGKQREVQQKIKQEKEQSNKKANELYLQELELLKHRQVSEGTNNESYVVNELQNSNYPENESIFGATTLIVIFLTTLCCCVLGSGIGYYVWNNF